MGSAVAVTSARDASALALFRHLAATIEMEDTFALHPGSARRNHSIVHVEYTFVFDLELCRVNEHLGDNLLELTRAALLHVQ